MEVRELVEISQRAELHPHFPTWFSPEVQCSAGSFWPSVGQLRRVDHVLVADHDGEPVGVLLTQKSGLVSWILTKPGHSGPAFAALVAEVFAQMGAVYGHVGNDQLRATYLKHAQRMRETDPSDATFIEWVA